MDMRRISAEMASDFLVVNDANPSCILRHAVEPGAEAQVADAAAVVAAGLERDGGAEDLAKITLMSDGASIYECTNSEEIFDLLQGGQGVFGIAIGKVWNEIEGSLTQLQGENPADGEVVTSATDELALRRQMRGA